jgi:hypothetical protein
MWLDVFGLNSLAKNPAQKFALAIQIEVCRQNVDFDLKLQQAKA